LAEPAAPFEWLAAAPFEPASLTESRGAPAGRLAAPFPVEAVRPLAAEPLADAALAGTDRVGTDFAGTVFPGTVFAGTDFAGRDFPGVDFAPAAAVDLLGGFSEPDRVPRLAPSSDGSTSAAPASET